MDTRTPTISTPHKCPICSTNTNQSATTCKNCKRHLIPQHKNDTQPIGRRHVEASLLLDIALNHTGTDRQFKKDLAALCTTPTSATMSSCIPAHTSVTLLLGDLDKGTPSISLETAEGLPPTIHQRSWVALDRPVWEGLEVYVCVERLQSAPVHKRNGECGKCVLAAWMNAGAQLMLAGAMGVGEEESRWDGLWEREEERGGWVWRAAARVVRGFRRRVLGRW